MRNLLAFISIVIVSVSAVGQKKLTREEYIAKYKDVAIQNMIDFKVPASITLAQACLESGNGNSDLSRRSNNHFGIKCHSSWKGKKTYHDDDEKQECFRVYKSVYDSYADHSEFLLKSRYAKCFELKITDYKGWAKELKRAGYATNPKYPALLIKIIEENKLYEYDQEALGKKKKKKKKNKELIAENNSGNAANPSANSSGTNAATAAGGTSAAVVASGNSNAQETKKQSTSNTSDNFDDVDYYERPKVRMSANKVKYIKASQGDNAEKIARKMQMGVWQITTYNNVDKDYYFTEGEKVYLQPKKSKGSKGYHIVKPKDSVWKISQQYGVKMSSICRYNGITKDAKLKPGQKIFLKRQ